MNEKELKIIHLVRKNTLEQYLSEVLAWKNREWTLKHETSNREKINLDLRALEEYRTRQKIQQEQCLEDFNSHERISISYESLINDPDKTLAEIQNFLGLSQRKLFTVMRKQSSHSLEEALENAEEVKNRFPEYFID